MSELRYRIVALIRDHFGEKKELSPLLEKTDESIARALFRSFRKSETSIKGLRLSSLGLDILSECFTPYIINRPDGRESVREILYLDRHSRLPYFYSSTKIVVFEVTMGTALMMSGGDFHILSGFDEAS